ncbi:hypothetical protein [Brevibacillus sp. NRS-1366]|uniref:hypothetical protein n=1 Tax=Brevibacillus sp. NRS-1366 TaxID=3233899 RepID=UPI003D2414CD
MKVILRLGTYLAFTILVSYFITILSNYEYVLFEQSRMNFERFPHLLYLSLYPILIGLLFALPHLLREGKETGSWKYDWVKSVAIGLPALFGTTVILLYFSPVGNSLPPFLTYVLVHAKEFTIISGIVFGYTVLTCLSKSTDK